MKREFEYQVHFEKDGGEDYGFEGIIATSAQHAVDIFRDYYGEEYTVTQVLRECKEWR